MSRLLKSLEPISEYKDRSFGGSLEEYVACLRVTKTVYVGNLAFHTSEEQIHELFSTCGPLLRIVMGLDRNTLTPCGFCFVVYRSRKDTEDCVKYLNGSKLDERVIRIDFDWGFVEGRQFGRGKSGGQVRDELRQDYDAGRGGYGKSVQSPVAAQMGYPTIQSGMQAGKRGREEHAGPFREQKRPAREWDNPRFRGERRDDDED